MAFTISHRSHKAKYKSLEEYEKLFEGVSTERVIGEATPTYLALPECAGSIKAHCPDAKILISLRNPVDRIFSYYEMSMSKGREPQCSFESWIKKNNFWLETGGYCEQLQRYLHVFGRNNVKVILYEDIQNSLSRVLDDICIFLGVSPLALEGDPKAFNSGGRPASRIGAVVYSLTSISSLNSKIRPFIPGRLKEFVHRFRGGLMVKGEIDAAVKEKLVAHFYSDIKASGELIGRDLSAWYC